MVVYYAEVALLGMLQMSLGGQAGGRADPRGSKYSLYQHTHNDEDSQGHDGDHHQGGDSLFLLAGGHHCQEVCMLTACTDVPRMAAGEEGNISTLSDRSTCFPISQGRLGQRDLKP